MRLTSSRVRATGRPITFAFEGEAIRALEGETIAAALAAADRLALRRTPSGAKRGVHCGMGACFDCVVTVDGKIGQRACMTRAAAGMEVRSAPPDQPLPLVPAPTVPIPETACDVLVVGGGPAGLSAAIAAAESGASVVLLDERAAPGGQYAKPLAPSHTDARPDRQFRTGLDLVARARAAGVQLESGASVWAAFAADEVAVMLGDQAAVFRPRALIAATGAHERPVPLPGWTLPGVMTTGGLQGLVRSHRVLPGETVLLAGSGPLNLQLACEILAGGGHVAAVVEAAGWPGRPGAWADLARMAGAAADLFQDGARYLTRLALAGVPVLWGSRLHAFEGTDRVESAIVATPRGARRIPVDAVGLNMGFVPETGLARSLGARHRLRPDGVTLETETDEDGRTSVAGLFAVGDGAELGGARLALARGRLAGLAAARDLGHAAPPDPAAQREVARARSFQAALWRVFSAPPPGRVADSTIVCRCEEVTAGQIRAAVAQGAESLAAVKRATRAGMGRCQGRFCASTVVALCPAPVGPEAFAAPRPPLRPVPVAALMVEAPEFDAPLFTRPPPPRFVPPLSAVPADRRCDVLVIGAGCVGLATARELARDGADVLAIDKTEPGLGASTANAGSLHAQLLAYDIDPEDPARETPAVHALPLGPASIGLWREIAEESGEGLQLTLGGLMLATSPAAMERLRAKVTVEARYGVETHLIGGNEVRNLMPAAGAVEGGVVCPQEGRIDPLRAMAALRRLAEQAGARVEGGIAVTAMTRQRAGWLIETGSGPILAGRVVIAAGAASAWIAALAGVTLPVHGVIQQVSVTEPAPILVQHLVAVADRHLSLKQQDSGGLLIGGGWFGRLDPDGAVRSVRRSIEGNMWVAGQVVPALAGLRIIRSWTGLAPSVDGAPVLGEVPGQPGLFVAAGANGLSLGPIFGRLTADALRGEAPDPRLRLERFA